MRDYFVETRSTYKGHRYGVLFMNPLDCESTPNFWIGFDCAHLGDGFTSGLFSSNENEEVRSKEYCVEECKKLIDQLIELEAKVSRHAPEKEAND